MTLFEHRAVIYVSNRQHEKAVTHARTRALTHTHSQREVRHVESHKPSHILVKYFVRTSKKTVSIE
jgi:hypothetical protein